jgi:hypothetical protein
MSFSHCPAPPTDKSNAERQENLDLAGQISRDDRARRQRTAASVDHAQTVEAFAGGHALPHQFEIDEIKIADQKGDEQHQRDRDADIAGLDDERDDRDIEENRHQQPDEHVDHQRDRPFADLREIDRQSDAFRRHDLAAIALCPFEEFADPILRDTHALRPAKMK